MQFDVKSVTTYKKIPGAGTPGTNQGDEMPPANQLNNEHSMDKVFLSINDLAKRWSISRGSVYSLIREGRVKSFTIHSRRLISLVEIKRVEHELQAGDQR